MAKKCGGFMDRPWVYHYECHLRDDGVWNAVVFAQGSLPIGLTEAPTRDEAEVRGFNAVLYCVDRENRDEARRDLKEKGGARG